MHTHYQYTHTIQLFYQLLEQKDLMNWMALWAKDAKNIFPYANYLINDTLEGLTSIQQFWSKSPNMYARLSLPVNEIYTKTSTAVAFFENNHLLKDSPQFYKAQNIGVFEFDKQGKIKCYTEYFDPINLGQTFQMIHITKLPQ